MRKRAQRKTKPSIEKPKHITKKKPEQKEKKFSFKKKGWVAIALISIFFIVLFFNTFFNVTSDVAINSDGEGFEKYYLSGPDPYYNMRLVKVIHETGEYPFYSDSDPLLNYPLGRSGGRAPLFIMSSFGFSSLLNPVMDEVDAIGRSMQFVPALFGALIIFPVYFIGKHVFNKKAGLIAAFFIAIIPIHIGSGHGSAYSLFDHDSFNLLMFFLTFLFLILSIKEKNSKKSVLYAILGGIPLAGLTMTWVSAQFLYVVIAVYAFVQMLFDIFLNKIELKSFRTTSIILFTGFLVSLPVLFAKSGSFPFNIPFYLCVAVTAFGLVYYIFGMKRIPWTLSLPAIFVIAAGGLGFLYAINIGAIRINILNRLGKLADVIFGSGIYGKKVSLTIAEANTYQISNTVMSFGPALYWVGWAGLLMLFYYYYKDKMRREYLFLITLFIINLWLTGVAGRFLNDMVPLIAILSGAIVWFLIEKIDYNQMIRNIKRAGGGLHGIRRGVKFLHVFGIIFIAFIVVLPNVFLALDAAVPSKAYQKEDGNWTNLKFEVFGEEHASAFGLGVGKERYWIDAFEWLSQQDKYDSEGNELADVDKPAFISWWDYGFYEVASGAHPTVADNFQDGIPPASNFHTATGEREAVTIWIVRLLEGVRRDYGEMPDEVITIFNKYLDANTTNELAGWVEDPQTCPSYQEPIDEEYHKYFKEDINTANLFVGAQWAENALYHDVVDLLVESNETSLTDDEITWLYHDIQDFSKYSIRYYGVEGYDKQIFNIFAFLSDKSLILLGAPEDEFVTVTFNGQKYRAGGTIEKTYTDEPLETYLEMSDSEKRYVQVSKTNQNYKDEYYETMFYKTYIGPYDIDQNTGQKKEWQRVQYPCVQMKHFYPEFISDVSDPMLQYQNSGRAAVVIAKYYEGAIVDGTISFDNESKSDLDVVVLKNLSYYEDFELPINHDQDSTDLNGNFSVLAGAGSYLQIRRNLGQSNIVLRNLTFNGALGTSFAPISDEDAMRQSSNYERFLNISIEEAVLSGYVYDDLDDDGVFNESVDDPLKNINVTIAEITNIKQDNSFDTGATYQITTDENGFYNQSGLYPGIYRIVFSDKDNYILDLADKELREGKTVYNVPKPKPADVEGVVYYDENLDENYDSGEEISDAELELYHNNEKIKETISDEEGFYKFESLMAGKVNDQDLNEYKIKVKKLPDYEKEISIYPLENETTEQNISLDLVSVEVAGVAKYNGQPINNVTIDFSKNESVDLNTAEQKTITTDELGTYSVELKPGSYNISISKSVTQGGEQDTVVYTSPVETLTLIKGQGSETKDFLNLVKNTVTIEGEVTYNDEPQSGVNVLFNPSDDGMFLSPALVTTTNNGIYTAEVYPGDYNITASASNLTGNEYGYSWSGSVSVTEGDIGIGLTQNIMLSREED